MTYCQCGCGKPASDRHHVLLAQRVRWAGGDLQAPANFIPLARSRHFAHHAATKRIAMSAVPDAAVEFARELIGPGPAYNYFVGAYSGAGYDRRVVRLLTDWEEAA